MAAAPRCLLRGARRQLQLLGPGRTAPLSSQVKWVERQANLETMSGRERFDTRPFKEQQGIEPLEEHLGPRDHSLRPIADEIRELAMARRWREALVLFSSVSEPDMHLRAAALRSCARAGVVDWAWKIFRDMPTRPLPVYNIMIALLGRARRIRDAEALLGELKAACLQPNAITMTSLITAYGVAQDAAAARRVLEEMESLGMLATEVTFGAAMGACGRSGDQAAAREVLAIMERQRVEPHVGHLTSLVVSCARSKDEASAREAFAEIRRRGLQPDVVAFTSLAACIAGPQALPKVEALLQELRAECLAPHAFFYNELLRAARESRDPARFQQVLSEMDAAGQERTSQTELHVQQEQRERKQEQSWPKAAEPSLVLDGAAALPPKPLPPGWRETVDPASGQPYYWSEADPMGTTTWQRPV